MYPFADEAPGDTLWELGLDFTVSPGKQGFRGAQEHYRLKGKERFKLFGLKLDSKEAAKEGSLVFHGDKQVGVVTCPMYSPLNHWSIGIARLDVPVCVQGTPLTVRGAGGDVKAIAHEMPFYDKDKKRRTVQD